MAVVAPPNKNAVEQIMALQQALAQVESTLQGFNIALLKARALVVSEEPQVCQEPLNFSIFWWCCGPIPWDI